LELIVDAVAVYVSGSSSVTDHLSLETEADEVPHDVSAEVLLGG